MFNNLFKQSFGIKTTGLEEKATACSMLVCYAKELKEGFAPYTEEVTRLMVPLFKFYFHDGVRTAAAEAMPHLLECAQIRGEQYVYEMWNYICNDLIKAIESEPEQEVLAELMRAFARVRLILFLINSYQIDIKVERRSNKY